LVLKNDRARDSVNPAQHQGVRTAWNLFSISGLIPSQRGATLMRRYVFLSAISLAVLAMPAVVQAQGIVRGAEQGAAVGNRAAGPVGGAVGGAVGGVTGGVVGGVKGVLGIPQNTGNVQRHRTSAKKRTAHH
jgi:hypothetical protein